MYLPMLTDREIVHYADTMYDPLLSSELEKELTRRLSLLVDRDEVETINDLISERTSLIRLLRFKVKPLVTDPNVLVLIDEALAPYTMEKTNDR